MTRLVLDRPDTPTDTPTLVPGCPLCGIEAFTTTDQALAAEFNRAHGS